MRQNEFGTWKKRIIPEGSEIDMEEKLRKIEALFVKYGARPTDLGCGFGERTIYACGGNYFRTGVAEFDGQPFLLISGIDREKYAELGILEDLDILPADAGETRMEKAVRYALGIEPYPEKYP